MLSNRYLGSHGRWTESPLVESALVSPDDWGVDSRTGRLSLAASGQHFHCFSFGPRLVLLRGQVVWAGAHTVEDVARLIQKHYLDHAELPIEHLEGSYTLVLMDGAAGRTLLYRNLVGTGFTYYTQAGAGLVFGSNLAELVATLRTAPRPNRTVLPAYFLCRFVPGRNTLFDGIHRLMPGELLVFDGTNLSRSQRQTFADLGHEPIRHDAVDQVEAALQHILGDVRAREPEAANLLSGGVDSSYLQAVWNQTAAGQRERPRSYCVSVAHARTLPDTEYALSAAAALGTRHALVPADGPYIGYLLDLIEGTGEPPNHVQAAYFGRLARVMVEEGATTGLCGEGADGLFGVGSATLVQLARMLRVFTPIPSLRRLGARCAGLFGKNTLQEAFGLTAHVEDPTWVDHPINHISVFSDREAMKACFSARGLEDGAAYRRGLLDQYRVPEDPLLRLHAAGFLGEAIDTASLWATLFHRAGGDLVCPFLDSRLLRIVLNIEPRFRFPFRKPKELLRQALCRHLPRDFAYRPKRGFGQPIMQWLAPGGQLRGFVDRIGHHDFVPRNVLDACRARPNWFLYSLLCYDLWHKIFIERRSAEEIAPRRLCQTVSG